MVTDSVSVIIPVYKPDKKFLKLMEMLKRQSYPVLEILCVNTEKKYWKDEWIKGMTNARVMHIKREEFDHGGTRAKAAVNTTGSILLFMTQDAVPADENLIHNLVQAFKDPAVKAAYARQLPDKNCNEIERYTRDFNYPAVSSVKTAADIKKMGIKTFFCSNVCAAYDRDAYEELGGFTTHTIFNEDMLYAAKVIHSGYAVAYQADACVIHSHNYGNIQQFKRNFDLAVSQKDHPEIFAGIKSESEGMRLVKSTASYLISVDKPMLILDLVVKSGFKFLGYRTGKIYRVLPKWMIRICTMNRSYWTAMWENNKKEKE